MFVYGPPGNGKTVISQAIHNLLEGELYIPHALEVEGSIIRFFDPVNHEPMPDESMDDALDLSADADRRWIRCRRPMVMVGGELSLDQLELSYSPTMGFYRAPVQAVANGGVLVIDDFGRQTCSPRDLLNRWIVPLESRVDFLTLQTGQKFDFPFMTLVVFATNVKPQDLVDEAFLRRIQYKIFAESPTRDEFLQIFANCCRDKNIEYRPDVIENLLVGYYRPRQIQLRGCQPRDLINQAISLADYYGKPPELTKEVLEAACASYFVDDREAPPSYA
jgi:predicted ATPase with chaperone activity